MSGYDQHAVDAGDHARLAAEIRSETQQHHVDEWLQHRASLSPQERETEHREWEADKTAATTGPRTVERYVEYDPDVEPAGYDRRLFGWREEERFESPTTEGFRWGRAG